MLYSIHCTLVSSRSSAARADLVALSGIIMALCGFIFVRCITCICGSLGPQKLNPLEIEHMKTCAHESLHVCGVATCTYMYKETS